MNIDFHYYATYYAAGLSGFKEGEAQKIAWAAQMVDELYPSYVAQCDLGEDTIVTCQESLKELIWDNIQYSDDFNSTISHGIRGIWAPFHFLPGHIDDGGINEVINLNYRNAKGNVEKYTQEEQDYIDICLALRCRKGTNSPTAKKMIEYVKKQYEKLNDDEGLYCIGLSMHVLADTWAHDDFAGIPCYMVNSIFKRTVLEDDSNSYLRSEVTIGTSLNRFAINSAAYLGHGDAGHAPDYDFLKYRYFPRYRVPGNFITSFFKLNQRMEINNPVRFQEAIRAMYNALCYIRNDVSTLNLSSMANGNKEIDDVKKSVFHKKPSENDASHDDVVVDRKNKWVDFLHRRKYGCPTDFSKEYGNIKLFARQAKSYRNYILSYINSEINAKRKNAIINFSIAEIDNFIKKIVSGK